MPLKLTTYYKGSHLICRKEYLSFQVVVSDLRKPTPGYTPLLNSGNEKTARWHVYRSYSASKKMAPLFIGKTLCSIQ